MSKKEVEANPYDHWFNSKVVPEFGFPAAVLFSDVAFWVKKNRKTRSHYYEGRHWVFGSRADFHRRHPYLSDYQIQAGFRALTSAGLLDVGRFNRLAVDRTRWYTLGPNAASYFPPSNMSKSSPCNVSETQHGCCEKTNMDVESNQQPLPVTNSNYSPLEGTDFQTKSPQEGEKRKLLPEEILDKRDHPTGRGVWMAGQWLPIYKPFADDPTCPEMVKFPTPTEECEDAWVWKRLSDKDGTQ